jgi:hypothetical protein
MREMNVQMIIIFDKPVLYVRTTFWLFFSGPFDIVLYNVKRPGEEKPDWVSASFT